MESNHQTYALVGGTLIDGTGKPPLKDSIIIIEKNKIKKIGTRSNTTIPDNIKIINTTGKTITPGFIDSHNHYYLTAAASQSLILNNTKSLQEVLNLIKEKINTIKPDEWIAGTGWDESNWPENRYITTEDLDKIAPNNPVGLLRVDVHMIVFNTSAYRYLEKTGKTIDTEDGQSSVNVLQNISNFVDLVLPNATIESFAKGLGNLAPYLFSKGCTGIHDPGLEKKGILAYQRALRDGAVLPRSYVMVMYNSLDAVSDLDMGGFDDDFLRIGSVKYWLDGSIGSRSAALCEGYSDDLDNVGVLLLPEYDRDLVKVHESLMQTSTHAIGDRAVIKVLDAFESVIGDCPRDGHRHRIEHCEMLGEEQIQRIRDLGVVAAMQPNFIGAWSILQPMYQQRLGEARMKWNNPYRQLLDAGVVVAFGSDGMPFGPMFGVWSAVNHPVVESRISLVEAVMCYTLNCAYAAFQEDKVGSIEVGKLADITVLEGDLTQVPVSDLLNVECDMTILDGNIVYKKQNR